MSNLVFRHYDQASLDLQYDNRKKVAGFDEWIARYDRDSAAAREKFARALDVAYGNQPRERLDIFGPSDGGQALPVHIFVHGGYWRAMEKEAFSFVAAGLVPAGALVVVIEYTLMPAVSMGELVRQCRAAVAWTYQNIAAHGGDPDRVYVSGHSAGGHLTAMLMATDWAEFADLPGDLLKGGVGISGLYDLEPIRLCFLNEDLALDRDTAAEFSPINLSSAGGGPLVLPVGGLEGEEYLRQSKTMSAAWADAGNRAEVVQMPGQDHFSIVGQLNDPASDLSRMILAQMQLA